MNQSSSVFGAVCFLAVVSMSVTNCFAKFDVGSAILTAGTVIKNCSEIVPFQDIPYEQHGYCMVACVWKQFNIMGQDNKLNFTRIEELATPYKNTERVIYRTEMEILQTCVQEVTDHSNGCVVAKELIKCATLTLLKKIFMATD